jgi:hypothetical protein
MKGDVLGSDQARRRQLRGYVSAVEARSFEQAQENSSAYQVKASPGPSTFPDTTALPAPSTVIT